MPIHVTDTELSILQILWERGPLPVRPVTEALYPDGSKAHYATVKKLLERLEAKGCVRRDRSEASHRFEAAIGRDDLISDRLRSMADQLCDGSLAPVLMHLVKARKLTKDERQSLRRLIDELDRPRGTSDSGAGGAGRRILNSVADADRVGKQTGSGK